jgi:hypothetical protein
MAAGLAIQNATNTHLAISAWHGQASRQFRG